MQPDGGSAPRASVAWFRQARFGLCVHWGPVSLEGTEIGWSRDGERPHLPVPHAPGSVPVERYDQLYQQFDPSKSVLSGDVVTTTHRGATVYVHFVTPGLRAVRLAGIDGQIVEASLLGHHRGEVSYRWQEGDLQLTLTGAATNEVVPVVRLELDRPVALRPSPWSSLGRQRAGT